MEQRHHARYLFRELNIASDCSLNSKVIIDSGATHTAAGCSWLDAQYRGERKPTITDSRETFKFGDSGISPSASRMRILQKVPAVGDRGGFLHRACRVVAEVIQPNMPLLVSRCVLGGIRSALKFTDNTLRINDLYDGELYLPESGHLILPAEALGDDSKEDANGFSPVNWATPKYPTNLPFGKYISIYPI